MHMNVFMYLIVAFGGVILGLLITAIFGGKKKKTKNSFASKINWIGFFLAMFGLMSDPNFFEYLSTLVSQEVLSEVMAISGALVMLIRTFATSQGLHLPGREKSNA